jgi:hypothetical protein
MRTPSFVKTLLRHFDWSLALFLVGCLPSKSWAADGDLDLSFGTGGKVTTPLSPMDDVIFSVAIDSNNRIVVTGGFAMMAEPAGPSNNSFGIARYTSSGVLDTTFGFGGKVVTDFYGSRDEASALTLDAGGKIATGVGQEVSAMVTFTNSGNAPLTAIVATVTPAGNTDFRTGSQPPSTLASGPATGTFNGLRAL